MADEIHSRHWRGKFAPSQTQNTSEREPLEESMATIALVRGKDAHDAPQWAYALIPADRYMAFRMAEAEGNYNLSEFGTVVHFGAGEQPPEDIQQEMAETYGCDPEFEAQMERQLSEAFDGIDWGE